MSRYRRGAKGRFAGSYGGGGRGSGLSLTGSRPASRRQVGAIVGASNKSGRRPSRIPGQTGRTRKGTIVTGSGARGVTTHKIYTQRVRLPKASAPAGSSRTNRTVIVVSHRK